MSTIQETINRLRELDQKASPAPWSYLILPVDLHTGIQDSVLLDGAGLEFSTNAEDAFTRNDFDVILEARNAIPALLAEIERLTADNDRLQCAEKELKERFTLIFNKWRSRRRDLIRRVQAEAWAEGYLDKETEASEAMIERGLRERAKNPYRGNKGTWR